MYIIISAALCRKDGAGPCTPFELLQVEQHHHDASFRCRQGVGCAPSDLSLTENFISAWTTDVEGSDQAQ